MSACKSWTKKSKKIAVRLWLAWIAVFIAQRSYDEDMVIDIYTLPKIPIKEFHTSCFPAVSPIVTKFFWVRSAAIFGVGRKIRAMSFGW
jgi:hypothetical protein